MQRMIMYAKEEAGKELQTRIVRRFPGVETVRTIEALTERLRQSMNNHEVAVLIAATEAELENFLALGDLLHNLKLVLVLPDRGHGSIARGHALRPRLLCYPDDDADEIQAVLAKMLKVAACKCNAPCVDISADICNEKKGEQHGKKEI
jgi:hypothetical protein